MKFTVSTKFAAVALLTITAAMYTSSCKDDILLPEPRGLLGTYSGVLIVTADETSVHGVVNDTDHVRVTLRASVDNDSTYQHLFDNTDFPSDDADICDVNRGSWSVVNSKLSLEPIDKGDGEVCNDLLIPDSLGFGFRPTTVDDLGDSLTIIQQKEGVETKFLLVLTEAL